MNNKVEANAVKNVVKEQSGDINKSRKIQKAKEIYNDYSNNNYQFSEKNIQDLMNPLEYEMLKEVKNDIRNLQDMRIKMLKPIENCEECNKNLEVKNNEIIEKTKKELSGRFFERMFDKNSGMYISGEDVLKREIDKRLENQIIQNFNYLCKKHQSERNKLIRTQNDIIDLIKYKDKILKGDKNV